MVQRKDYQVVIAFIIMLIFVACSNDEKVIITNDDDLEACDTTIRFSDIQPIINNNCGSAGCHGAGAGSRALVTYNDLSTSINSGNFENRVLSPTADMPLGRDWDNLENRQKLKCWIENGFPE
jgi:hypothetical protein